jgi:lipoprotein-releasing system permease protein
LKLPFSFFLALRYLKPKRSFLSVISVITLAGVTIGIAVLVVVIAVMTGFHEELRRKILGHEPHLIVSAINQPLEDEGTVRKMLDAQPGIEATSPFVMAPVLLERDSEFLPAKMRGIYPRLEEKLLSVKQYVKWGEFDLDGDKCVLGIELARELHIQLHDKVLIHGPNNMKEVMRELKKAEEKDPKAKTLGEIRSLIQPAELEVTGFFETGHFQYDQEFILLPLHTAQEIYGLEDQVHGIAVRTKDPFWAENYKPTLAAKLGPDFEVTSWIDLNRKFFQAVEMERTLLFFIVALVVVVAGFSITNTLITITFQKKRDIGVLKALGASPNRIIRVFLSQGVVVGLVGNLLGFSLAAAIIYWRDQIQALLARLTGHEIFAKEIYQFSRIPAEIVPGDMLVIGSLSFGICVLAAMVPAWFAARLDPVRALREE